MLLVLVRFTHNYCRFTKSSWSHSLVRMWWEVFLRSTIPESTVSSLPDRQAVLMLHGKGVLVEPLAILQTLLWILQQVDPPLYKSLVIKENILFRNEPNHIKLWTPMRVCNRNKFIHSFVVFIFKCLFKQRNTNNSQVWELLIFGSLFSHDALIPSGHFSSLSKMFTSPQLLFGR